MSAVLSTLMLALIFVAGLIGNTVSWWLAAVVALLGFVALAWADRNLNEDSEHDDFLLEEWEEEHRW